MKCKTPPRDYLWLSLAALLVGVLLLWPVFCRGAVIYSVCSGSASMGRGVSTGVFWKERTLAIIPWKYEDLRIGLIVARAARDRNGKLVAYVSHRIIAKDGPLWVLQGDNPFTNRVPDLIRLTPNNFIGVYADPVTLKPLP